MGEVLLFSLSFALGIAVPAAIISHDLEGLRGEQWARAWPEASVWSAVVVFGPLCLPIHFIKTRRSWLGVFAGIGWLACALLLITVPVELWSRIFGLSD